MFEFVFEHLGLLHCSSIKNALKFDWPDCVGMGVRDLLPPTILGSIYLVGHLIFTHKHVKQLRKGCEDQSEVSANSGHYQNKICQQRAPSKQSLLGKFLCQNIIYIYIYIYTVYNAFVGLQTKDKSGLTHQPIHFINRFKTTHQFQLIGTRFSLHRPLERERKRERRG